MTSQFPAVLVGGHPHRGKSVLGTMLSYFLRVRQIAHYPLRATPDGEGNWSHQADPVLAQQLRQKRGWDDLERALGRSLQQRVLPLLVDAGGRPTPAQEAFLAHSTHALLVGKDEAELAHWRAWCDRLGLSVLAEVVSVLEGSDTLLDEGIPLRLRLSDLTRGRHGGDSPPSPAWEALVQRVAETLHWSEEAAWRHHRDSLPLDTMPLHLTLWCQQQRGTERWTPDLLPHLLAGLSPDGRLATYGPAPAWVMAALGAYLQGTWQLFDAQYGWITPPTLHPSAEEAAAWTVTPTDHAGMTILTFQLALVHQPPAPALAGPLPEPAAGTMLALSGKLPLWLFAALGHHYGQRGYTLAITEPRGAQAIQITGAGLGQAHPWQPAAP